MQQMKYLFGLLPATEELFHGRPHDLLLRATRDAVIKLKEVKECSLCFVLQMSHGTKNSQVRGVSQLPLH